jgi:hypothetical protein
MKNIKQLFFVIPILFISVKGFAENDSIHPNHQNHANHNLIYSSISKQKSQIVYVCMGTYAYAYHSQASCSGLANCQGEIKYADENYAINALGRVPCCKCWSNVYGRCKDDNPYGSAGGGSGGGGGEALAVIALAVVATSVVILSNDLYLYPVLSFYKPKSINYNYSQGSMSGISTGWAFGFRKKFEHSALEYGLSFLKTKVEYDFGMGYTYDNYISRIGGHLNYVHHIFYYRTPSWLKLYFGPSINYVYKFGFGGIFGSEIKLFERLRFDVRYELTNQTNQIQAGLIFTYQKKYFWQK